MRVSVRVLGLAVLFPALPLPLAAAVELSAKEAAAARQLSLVKCVKCHKFYEPVGYTQADWADWMEKMRRKSKLKPEQFDLLSRYLEEARAQGRKAGK